MPRRAAGHTADDDEAVPDDITVRAARPDDVDALAALMFLEPSREAVVMAGGREAGRRFRAALLRHGLTDGSSAVLVAEEHGEPVGFAEVGSGGEIPALRIVARHAIASMGVLGALRSAWRSTARLKVDLTAPPGGVHLIELQVSPRHRNRGIGRILLDHVEARARKEGAEHVSLTTASDNPARRLYQRNGYAVAAEKADARYQRLTGSPGRVLMVKPLP